MDLDELKKMAINLPCKGVSVANIDFSNSTCNVLFEKTPNNIFDLASLTKPLTLGALRLYEPKLFNEQQMLLLEHRSGLPSWARLHRETWRDLVNSYSIAASNTVYSDLGFLRLMLELNISQSDWVGKVKVWYENNILFWKDLDGKRVYDDNAFIIGSFCTHAGLFSTIEGLGQALIGLNKQTDFLIKISKAIDHISPDQRFVWGWDRALGENTLAGKNATPKTFGHLGFTGTSIWIRPEENVGQIILTDFVHHAWFDRDQLNSFRRHCSRFY